MINELRDEPSSAVQIRDRVALVPVPVASADGGATRADILRRDPEPDREPPPGRAMGAPNSNSSPARLFKLDGQVVSSRSSTASVTPLQGVNLVIEPIRGDLLDSGLVVALLSSTTAARSAPARGGASRWAGLGRAAFGRSSCAAS
jgi:hypothetical protein